MIRKSRHTGQPSVGGMISANQENFLAAIDKLRELGVNEDISLPQLVVVGDQSSGKSSLLEGLTGFKFPVATDLCTRFATQIVMTRAPQSSASIRVSIIPGIWSRMNESIVEEYKTFAHTTKGSSLELDVFLGVLSEASALMDLPQDLESSTTCEKRFSEDVLKIEISGPDQQHLSVVDVPGLFHNPTIYQTAEDLDTIRNLIDTYVRDERTIILAVMDARNNLANQEVFKLARQRDPQGIRTVGVITKCDALQPGDEEGVLRIANNQVEHLKHGWFVVRNRSTKDITDGVTVQQRNQIEEQFFSEKPWDALQRQYVGISALKKSLGKLLYNHIKGEFPNVAKEIERLHANAQRELGGMGPSRQTPMAQRQYLMGVFMSYQKLVDESLHGGYDSSLDESHPSKLRMHLRNNNDDYERRLRSEGHTMVFRGVTNEEDSQFQRGRNNENDIYTWIRHQYRTSRGAELPGTVNPTILETLFRQQTVLWDAISTEYVLEAAAIIGRFIETVQNQLVPYDTVREAILSRMRLRSANACRSATDELARFLADERSGPLQTINHYFADTLSSIREQRVLDRFRQMGMEENKYHQVTMREMLRVAHLSNEDQAVNDIHDILKAYYQVALKRFMDNILNAVVERHLLGSDGAVRWFGPEYVTRLDDEELTDIANETDESVSDRREAYRKMQMFEEAMKIVRGLQSQS